ncbi:MAG: DEAD/DEAH box helicase, partial [Planctomycetota bacterium]
MNLDDVMKLSEPVGPADVKPKKKKKKKREQLRKVEGDDRRPEPAETTPDAPAVRFADLSLPPALVQAVEVSGYTEPTLVQQQVIPPMLSGRDVLAQSQTGSGKTAAFALPILARLDEKPKRVQTLVLTPTRELAIQVTEAFERYASEMQGFRALAIYGGQDYEQQFRWLRQGVSVVVGTPGRVIDHIKRGTLDLSSLDGLVLDEADEMLKMGFLEDVEYVLKQTPSGR